MTHKKVALVTGASRGIGRAIAEALGHAGMVVVGSASSDGGAEAISAYLGPAGIDATGVRLPGWRDSLPDVVSAILDTGQLRT